MNAKASDPPTSWLDFAYKMSQKHGLWAVLCCALVVCGAWIAKLAVEKAVVPLVDVVSENLRTQTAQLKEQTNVLKDLQHDSDLVTEFRLRTVEIHDSQLALLKSINDGQVRLEEQNRTLIELMRTCGEGLKEILRENPTKPKIEDNSGSG